MNSYWYRRTNIAQMGQDTLHSNLPRLTLSVLLGLFLIFEVFNGPLRYGLSQLGLAVLVYVPKALLLLAFIFVPLARGRVSRGFLIVTTAMLGYLILGMVQLQSNAQALFGLWVMAPLLFGLLAGPVLMREPARLCRLFATLFWIAWVGVVLNVVIIYPWMGSNYQLAGVSVEASRQWGTLGFSRLPGFSRASFASASQLLMFGMFLVFTLRSARLRKLTWWAAGVGILLTTSKGPLVAWLLITLYFMIRPLGVKKAWDAALILATISMIMLPLSTLMVTYDPHFSDPLTHLLFASFGDRLNWMWPDSFGLINQPWQWLIGRGLGGIGVPQQYFEPAHFMAADNFFVYLCVDFGLIGALSFIVASVFIALRRNQAATTRLDPVFTMILATLAYGVVVNVVEEPTVSLFVAMAITAPKILHARALAIDNDVPNYPYGQSSAAPSPSH